METSPQQKTGMEPRRALQLQECPACHPYAGDGGAKPPESLAADIEWRRYGAKETPRRRKSGGRCRPFHLPEKLRMLPAIVPFTGGSPALLDEETGGANRKIAGNRVGGMHSHDSVSAGFRGLCLQQESSGGSSIFDEEVGDRFFGGVRLRRSRAELPVESLPSFRARRVS